MDLICPITDLQRQVYESLLNQGRAELGNDLQAAIQTQAMSFFSLLTRLRQACCDPGLIPDVAAGLDQSGKMQTLLTHLEEALEGEGARKVVIFSQFVQLLTRLKPLVKESFRRSLAGVDRTDARSSKAGTAFQDTKGPAVIFVSLRAGGTGLRCMLRTTFSSWILGGIRRWRVRRGSCHRIGQQKRFCLRMITQGTIEERIQHLKTEKRELFENTWAISVVRVI